jgi:hypothetical protein
MSEMPELPEPAGWTLCNHENAVLLTQNYFTAAQMLAIRDAAFAHGMRVAAQTCVELWDLRHDERARMHAAKCAAAILAKI